MVVSRSLDAPGVVDVKLSSTFARIGLSTLSIKFSLTFTDFPSNVRVVPMLAFFVYARFFLPTSRRRALGRRHSRPTRVMRFRHAARDSVLRKRDHDDHDDDEEERIPTERKRRREKKGKKKNVTRLFEEKERNVSKLSSLVRIKRKKKKRKKKKKKKRDATFRKLLL